MYANKVLTCDTIPETGWSHIPYQSGQGNDCKKIFIKYQTYLYSKITPQSLPIQSVVSLVPVEDFDIFSPRVDARHFPPRTQACVGSSCGRQWSSGGG